MGRRDDMDAKFDAQSDVIEIDKKGQKAMKNIIRIKATTMTPLVQTDSNGETRKRYIYEDGQTGKIPFFSANGLRGGLRRMATKEQVEKAKEIQPDISVSPDAFYLYTSGAALDKKALLPAELDYEDEKRIRKDVTILSLFGAGLSQIEGKLAVVDMMPTTATKKLIAKVSSDGSTYIFSPLLGHETFSRADAIDASSLWAASLGKDYESIREWRDEYISKVLGSKESKKAAIEKEKEEHTGGKEVKEEFSHIKQRFAYDFMLPGVELTSSIGSKYGFELTDVEIGCIVSALKELSMTQIGSHKRIGFGVLDWEVSIGDTLLFKTECNPDYVLDKKVVVTDAGQEKMDKWVSYLDEYAITIADPLCEM